MQRENIRDHSNITYLILTSDRYKAKGHSHDFFDFFSVALLKKRQIRLKKCLFALYESPSKNSGLAEIMNEQHRTESFRIARFVSRFLKCAH